MASSLMLGLIDKGRDAGTLIAADPSEAQRAQLQLNGIEVHSDNIILAKRSRVLVLAVKPQILKTVVTKLSSVLTTRHLLISIAAGVPLQSIETWAGQTLPVVRCMPNTPALVGAGMTALYANLAVTPEQRDTAEAILSAVGKIAWVREERDLDAVTAVSGSGPAYFFYFMQAMQKEGERLGLKPELTRTLVLETAYGAALMARESNAEVSELRHNVTSPGGTTEAALNVLEKFHTRDIIGRALTAAAERSRQLAKETE